MRRFLMIIFFFLMLFPWGMASAQDVYLEIGSARLFFLPEASETLELRVSAPENSTLYFRLDYLGATSLDLRLSDPSDAAVPFTSRQEGISTFVEAPVTAGSDYFLAITSANTYLRVQYDLNPLPALSIGENQTPFYEPMNIIFNETFDNNDRSWWTGETETTISKIVDGVFSMSLEPNGQTFAGFSSLAGTESGIFYYKAELTIEGDTEGANLGLLFQVVDGANYYLFQILPHSGEWRFLVLDDGVWKNGFGWNEDARLKGATGLHRIGVWAYQNTYFFLWDGQFLGHIQDDTHFIGGIGLFAETPPDATGSPHFIWDNVQVGVPESTWAQPVVHAAGVLTETTSMAFASEEDILDFTVDLVGEWHWNDETNSQTMDWVFSEDGKYKQVIWDSSMDAPQEQSGNWYIENDSVLVLQVEGLPNQRYSPQLDDAKVFLTIPELNNRIFVRIES